MRAKRTSIRSNLVLWLGLEALHIYSSIYLFTNLLICSTNSCWIRTYGVLGLDLKGDEGIRNEDMMANCIEMNKKDWRLLSKRGKENDIKNESQGCSDLRGNEKAILINKYWLVAKGLALVKNIPCRAENVSENVDILKMWLLDHCF